MDANRPIFTYKLFNSVINKNNHVNKIDDFVLSIKHLSGAIVFIFTNCLTKKSV